MFQNEYPVFVHKHLLKIEMLENLRDYPRDIINIFNQNLSDGILKGCEIEVTPDALVIHPGIIVFHQVCYLLREAEQIPYSPGEEEVYLKIKFSDIQKNIEKVSYLSRLILDREKPNQKDEMELCRFLLHNGFRLRDDHKDFADFSTRYNTLNYINSPFAGAGGSTLAPNILLRYAKEAVRCRLQDQMDIVFCMGILNADGAVSKRMLTAYLNNRLEKEKESYSSLEMYQGLLEILENIKSGRSKSRNRVNEPRKILM